MYYYDDPLAAAWMEKRHGIKIEFERFGSPDSDINTLKSSGLWYIRPDSLHLLVPQQDDLIGYKWGSQYECRSTFYAGNWTIKMWPQIIEEDREQEPRIIQRSGIPFMWPKQEDTP